jgi:hypothetical protein
MPDRSKLPEWQAHGRRHAAPIQQIEPPKMPDGKVKLTLAGGYHIQVDRAVFDRHQPRVGYYYVLYPDGYESFSPKEAWERDHSLAGQRAPIEQPGKALE